jgi:hypothetical protein
MSSRVHVERGRGASVATKMELSAGQLSSTVAAASTAL